MGSLFAENQSPKAKKLVEAFRETFLAEEVKREFAEHLKLGVYDQRTLQDLEVLLKQGIFEECLTHYSLKNTAIKGTACGCLKNALTILNDYNKKNNNSNDQEKNI